MLKTTYSYENQDNYLFDPTKIEVGSGEAKLKKIPLIKPEVFKCHLNESSGNITTDVISEIEGLLINFSDSDRVPAKLGNGIKGNNSGYIQFGNILDYTGEEPFSVEFWALWTAAGTQIFISKKDNTNAGFQIYSVGGSMRFAIKGQDASYFIIQTDELFDDGAFHHVVLTYDGSKQYTGAKLYVDSIDCTFANTGTEILTSISNVADFQISGKAGNNFPLLSETIIDECVVYNRVLTTEEIETKYNLGNGTEEDLIDYEYPQDNPTLKPVSKIFCDGLDSLVHTLQQINIDDNVKYTLEIDGIEKWFDGNSWINSNLSYAQTNTIEEINLNAETLGIENGVLFRYVAYFKAGTINTTPILNETEITYDFASPKPDINVTIVYGYLYDATGKALENINVEAKLTDQAGNYNNIATIGSSLISTKTDQNGYWELILNDTENMEQGKYYDFYFKSDDGRIDIFRQGRVPRTTSINFNEL